MSEGSVFQLYAEEAMRDSTNAASEGDRHALQDLACTWAKAAVTADRLTRFSFISLPLGADETKLSPR